LYSISPRASAAFSALWMRPTHCCSKGTVYTAATFSLACASARPGAPAASAAAMATKRMIN
jgi:hypothetical protein